jgi:hypothetical protein
MVNSEPAELPDWTKGYPHGNSDGEDMLITSHPEENPLGLGDRPVDRS